MNKIFKGFSYFIEECNNFFEYSKTIKGKNSEIIHRFICDMKLMYCIDRCGDKEVYSLIELEEPHRVKTFDVVTNKQNELICVRLPQEKHMHPRKDPKTNLLCIGEEEGKRVTEDLVKNICKIISTFKLYDCYIIPEAKNTTEWRSFECQIS